MVWLSAPLLPKKKVIGILIEAAVIQKQLSTFFGKVKSKLLLNIPRKHGHRSNVEKYLCSKMSFFMIIFFKATESSKRSNPIKSTHFLTMM